MNLKKRLTACNRIFLCLYFFSQIYGWIQVKSEEQSYSCNRKESDVRSTDRMHSTAAALFHSYTYNDSLIWNLIAGLKYHVIVCDHLNVSKYYLCVRKYGRHRMIPLILNNEFQWNGFILRLFLFKYYHWLFTDPSDAWCFWPFHHEICALVRAHTFYSCSCIISPVQRSALVWQSFASIERKTLCTHSSIRFFWEIFGNNLVSSICQYRAILNYECRSQYGENWK